MMRRPGFAAFAATLALAAAGACGGDQSVAEHEAATTTPPADSAEGEYSGPKACDLIDEAELERIVGVDLEPAHRTNDYAGDSSCHWALPGDAQRGVKLALHAHGDLENYRRIPGSEEVAGLGDAAVWHPTYGQIAVLQGDAVLSVSLLVARPERAPTEAIARRALATLGGAPTQ